ncbi:MAG: carboxypeptidase-like regulatory domain-containing protein [Acidobacteria bacterium]|nr:carboxypeptidase-like regulatory domain-containing protein [Acidobacteriota bacterium]
MKLSRGRSITLVVVGVVLFCGTGLAQNTGSLSGTTTDSSGAVVPSVAVTITSSSTGFSREAVTNDSGVYTLGQLPPGIYRIEFKKDGFKTAVREAVEIKVGLPTRLDLTLELGAITEQVMVTSTTALINYDNATVGNPLSELQVRQLPIEGRNPAQLLSLQAGVIWSGEEIGNVDWRAGSVFGSRSNQGNISLDGADVNDQYQQAAMESVLPVPLDSVQEFRVTTHSPTADLGRSEGAQISLVTKQGSNDFHGSVYWFHRNEAFASNGFFENQVPPPPGQTHAAKAPLKRHIYGASGGGPIFKDRFFFFVNWEGRRDATGTPQDRQVPTDSFRDGVVQYQCQNAALCPGGTVNGLTGSHTVPAGYFGLTPAILASAIDPCGSVACVDIFGNSVTPGVNPDIISLFQSRYPTGNLPLRGRDAGINFSDFFFTPPISVKDNVYVARFDFNIDRAAKHTLFWRGTLASINRDQQPSHFPGDPASVGLVDASKGFSLAYGAQISPAIVNTFRWGFTRQQTTNAGQDGLAFHPGNGGYATPFAESFSGGRRVPVQQLSNDLSIIKGRHLFQVGGVFRQVTNNRFQVGPNHIWINHSRMAQSGGHCVLPGLASFDCPNLATLNALPAISSSFSDLYRRALGVMLGTMSQFGTTQFLVDPQTLTPEPVGTPLTREFRNQEFEIYFQDSFRPRSDLTINAGLRYSYFGPPWEVNGFQTGVSLDMRDWWRQRNTFGEAAISSSRLPRLLWSPSGKANDGVPIWQPDENNFAPRFSIGYSPQFSSGVGKFLFGGPGKSSIRAGYAVTFVHMAGTAFPNIEGQGLSQNLITAVGAYDYFNNATGQPAAPRFTGLSSLPSPGSVLSPPAVSFPFDPGTGANRILMASNRLVTPYSQHITLTVQREISTNYSVEVGYVGRLGRKLLAEVEYNAYLNLRDPVSGMTLYETLGLIDDFTGASRVAPFPCPMAPSTCNIAPIPFIENVYPNLANRFGPGTATQNFAFQAQTLGAQWELLVIGFDNTIVSPGSLYNSTIDPQGTGRVLISPQFRGLTVWDNAAYSSYNGMFLTFRKRMSGGLQFDANYTWSKALDNTTGLEQDAAWLVLAQPFDPSASWAPSEFDVRHNFNANWIYELPIGRGKSYGADMAGWADQIIGGWRLSGVWRWRSGFPLRLGNGLFFTNGFVNLTFPEAIAPIKTNITKNSPCGVSYFTPAFCGSQSQIFSFFRHTRAGEAGTRNPVRGGRFFTIDISIGKSFRMPIENHRLQFRWEIFNLTNTVSFASDPVGFPWQTDFGGNINESTFGQIFRTASSASQTFPQVPHNRVMQVGLRYEF